jgi:hypothetical protein
MAMRNKTLQLKASAVGSPAPVTQTAQAWAASGFVVKTVAMLHDGSIHLGFIKLK